MKCLFIQKVENMYIIIKFNQFSFCKNRQVSFSSSIFLFIKKKMKCLFIQKVENMYIIIKFNQFSFCKNRQVSFSSSIFLFIKKN